MPLRKNKTNRPENSSSARTYQPFTAKLIWQEVAPHTWPAAIIPVLLAVVLSSHMIQQPLHGALIPAGINALIEPDLITVCALLLIAILMQSSVNVFNDYYDFIKGNDTIENSSTDTSDAVLVYNNINPRSVFTLAIGLLVSAFLVGMYIVAVAGWIPLAIGVIGAFFVAIYSAGKTPISYYPIGEAVSGIVMGGLITLASSYVLTGCLDFRVLIWSLPVIIGIGLIMLTNNTCDIEKDRDASRKTLSAIIGREKARKTYHTALIVWIVLITLFVAVVPYLYTIAEYHTVQSATILAPATAESARIAAYSDAFQAALKGLTVVPFMLLAVYPQMRALWNNPLTSKSRDAAMPQCLSVNITLGLFYCIGLLLAA